MSNETKIVKSLMYYSPHRQQTFQVPIRDAEGKLQQERDRFGNLILGRRKQPVILTRPAQFSTLIDSPKLGYLCVYKVDFIEKDGEVVPVDADVYKQLEKLADDLGTKVIREDDHKRNVNPAAFEMEKIAKAKDKEIEQLRNELSKNSNGESDTVSALQRELADLKATLDEKTKPNDFVQPKPRRGE